MNIFLDTSDITNKNQEYINYLDWFIIIKEIEVVIKIFPTLWIPESDGYMAEFFQTFKEKKTPMFFNLLTK